MDRPDVYLLEVCIEHGRLRSEEVRALLNKVLQKEANLDAMDYFVRTVADYRLRTGE